MILHTTRSRVFRVLAFSGLVLATTVASAAKAPKPPSDLTGTWSGTYKAGSESGPITLSFAQSGADGTISGTAMDPGGLMIDISGNYSMSGRKIAAGSIFIDDGIIMETAALSGKATASGVELKIKLKSPNGKAKATLTLN